ncbi:MAG: ComF family protein [Gammaproteobacteria bacterium]|nr:ComF family protein [Gammaproteobacteria bacterium]MCP5137632.1 ComF family protein [Gammaproteobacteria bacterium]
MEQAWRSIQDWFLGPRCVLCGDRASVELELCEGCLADLPRLGGGCPRCGEPTPAAQICGACLRRPPPFDYLYAPFRYRLPLDWLVQGLKFERRLNHASILAEVLRRVWRPPDARPDLLIPVPLHASRLRERGFNQAIELFAPLARDLGVPIERRLALRSQATPAQAGLDARARRRNVRGAFVLRGNADRVRGKSVVILDDVVTTGSTVAELARVLRRAGARRVGVWALARTVVP